MKLAARDLARHLARSARDWPAILLFGPDPVRIAERRRDLASALAGPDAEIEMRLARLSAADLRKDTATLGDALKATGFFPGPRVVVLEDATDGLAPVLEEVLADWRQGDAVLVVGAGNLGARSTLRKLFESHKTALCVGIYADPPSRAEVQALLSRAGVGTVADGALADLVALARVLGPGDFAQLVEKLALYTRGAPGPVSAEDVAAVAPLSTEAGLDEVLDLLAEGRSEVLAPVLSRLAAQGTSPVGVMIAAGRHFRRLHAAAADPKGPEAALMRARPPVFGPRRDRMVRQARAWGVRRLEEALAILVETDLALRSSRPAPQAALMERALIRLAMLNRN
ncbi:MAG: DNA polymerase III subunit delta [Alphaproteobacteria bacterium HGW-Alphaproteobacteria-2]|nr:MAG: DNA polymerase III subunit delta [Alphaproteobacteria bacterium HGW-Alphaproteobacteria-2]